MSQKSIYLNGVQPVFVSVSSLKVGQLLPFWSPLALFGFPFDPFWSPLVSFWYLLGSLNQFSRFLHHCWLTFGLFFDVFRGCFSTSFFEGVFDDVSEPFSITNDCFWSPFGIEFRTFFVPPALRYERAGFRFEPLKPVVFCVYS